MANGSDVSTDAVGGQRVTERRARRRSRRDGTGSHSRRRGPELFASPFALFHLGSAREERLDAYIVREHRRGRALAEIIDDPYLRSRCSRSQLGLLLESPRLIRALAADFTTDGNHLHAGDAGEPG